MNREFGSVLLLALSRHGPGREDGEEGENKQKR